MAAIVEQRVALNNPLSPIDTTIEEAKGQAYSEGLCTSTSAFDGGWLGMPRSLI